MWIDQVNLTPLIKAFEKFEQFRPNQTTEQEKAGVIQAFEYCYELSWKTMKRLLQERGVEANSPRETFRLAAKEGFIDSPETWFVFLKCRNITVHTYNIDEANRVLEVCSDFSKEIKQFLVNIGADNDKS